MTDSKDGTFEDKELAEYQSVEEDDELDLSSPQQIAQDADEYQIAEKEESEEETTEITETPNCESQKPCSILSP
jgi:hypothetical protein